MCAGEEAGVVVKKCDLNLAPIAMNAMTVTGCDLTTPVTGL
jgi:hypothetical protein